jgi:hypothetical protein
MDIYLTKNKVNAGPYSESEVMARVKDGRYSATDLAWYAGCTEPVPLIDILCNPLAAEATAPEPTITMPVTTKPTQKAPAQNQEVFSAGDLRLIAENYTTLLGVAIVWAVGLFIPMSDITARFIDLLLAGLWIRSGWRLSKGLHRRPWVWVIWSFLPLANIYALVRILCTAARTLKANAVPLKFLVPDQVALARLAQMEPPKAQA